MFFLHGIVFVVSIEDVKNVISHSFTDQKLIYKDSVKTLILMLNINCSRINEPRQLQFVLL